MFTVRNILGFYFGAEINRVELVVVVENIFLGFPWSCLIEDEFALPMPFVWKSTLVLRIVNEEGRGVGWKLHPEYFFEFNPLDFGFEVKVKLADRVMFFPTFSHGVVFDLSSLLSFVDGYEMRKAIAILGVGAKWNSYLVVLGRKLNKLRRIVGWQYDLPSVQQRNNITVLYFKLEYLYNSFILISNHQAVFPWESFHYQRIAFHLLYF